MTAANSPASKEVVTAALLVIGGKILSGRTKNQNIGYIAEYLTALGIDLKEVRVVGDEETAIVDALNALRHRCTYVFTTGGIGPTHNDITADCVEGVRCADRHRSTRGRHPARMAEGDRRRDE
jgi:molybdopterin-biosynthesis enzyme MoeA-like protein